MNITLLILCLILFALAVSYKIISRQKYLTEKIHRQKVARYIAIFDATEELLANANRLPYSSTLVICLYLKMFDALQSLDKISSKDSVLIKKIQEIQSLLQKAQRNPASVESAHFHIPQDDNQAISMLKLVKRLKNVIKIELNKDRLTTKMLTIEDERLTQIRMKINIENLKKRANAARDKGQLSTASQLLKKSLELLTNQSDPYSLNEIKNLNATLNEIIPSLDSDPEKNDNRYSH